MYFPVGWPKHLHIPREDADPPLYVVCNADRLLFAVITRDSLGLWFCKPAVQLVCIRRTKKCVEELGVNQLAEWKPDSSMIAVTTARGYIVFYRVEVEAYSSGQSIFVLHEAKRPGNRLDGGSSMGTDSLPALRLSQSSFVEVLGGVTSMVCLREELMIATGLGKLHRIRWDGVVNGDLAINIMDVPFAVDMQHSRASKLTSEDVSFKQIYYSPMLGGFAVVLSTGQAAFITATSQKFEPTKVQGVWAQEVTNASCVAINHKYMLMAFGCKNGEGVVCSLDDLTGALHVSHRLTVSSRDFPDAGHVCGPVSQIRWTPDGCALALTWEKGGFSLWSVFGSLLLCSVQPPNRLEDDDISGVLALQIKSFEWGMEGYHLWVVCNKPHSEDTEVVQLQLVKSSLTVNPCMSNHEHVFLQGEDKLYLSTEDSVLKSYTQASAHGAMSDSSDSVTPFMGNRHWQIVPLPHAYLTHNWPIRYAAVDRVGHCVAVAGKTGLAHYTLSARKWKLFGNETQERDMLVSGGLTWWKDFICAACFNLLDQRDEIRFYPRGSKLDNTFAYIVRVPSQIILLNTFRNILIVLCADCHIMMFNLQRKDTQPNPTIIATKLQEVAIGNFIPHPATVTALTLTSLRTETVCSRVQSMPCEAESIIVNVAGRLLMFQRDRSGPQLKNHESKERALPFCAPVMVASCVENLWWTPHSNGHKPHLMEALWLACGAAGMKVWLPLYPQDEGKTHGFMSKRIMLPFKVDIYPLAVLFEATVLLGAASDTRSYGSETASQEVWPYLALERTSQIYLHQILRQLLRRNLGVHALQIARCCTDLGYFPHTLELLVHEVLEEEATSKEPIPDPLLPRVVAFVQEFPEYLQTVVHCARKTEVALWPYLFNTVGNPKDLFEECLMSGQLPTAASYLIILQNLEEPMISRQHATLLLDAALEKCHWDLARDLVRFLKAIDPSEAESPHSTTRSRMSGTSVYAATYPSPPMSPQESSAFLYGTTMRNRSISLSHAAEENHEPPKPKEKVRHSKSDGQKRIRHNSSSKDGKEESSAEQFFIDVILSRHARKLLSSYCLRDLGCFAANVEDYQLVAWLKRERLRAARVEDFVAALKKVHEDFQWPLPIMTYNTLQRMASSSSLGSPQVTDPLNVQVNGPSVAQLMDQLDASHGSASPSTSKHNLASVDSSSNEVLLQPQISKDDGSFATTEQSDNSSAQGDLDFIPDNNSWAENICLSELEQLSHELANKGPPRSEVELRYLFQVLLEAGCLEWSLLIAILLRDAMAVVRTVNTTSLTDTPLEIVARMREGLSYLELWADTECFGYKPFLVAIRGQTQLLQKIAEQAPPSRLSTSSADSGHTGTSEAQTASSEVQSDGEKDPETPVVSNVEEENSYECAIS